MSVEDATAALTKIGLKVDPEQGQTDSPTVAVGLVAETDPPLGSRVVQGGTVQLLISTGPKAIPVPVFAGMTEDQAKDAIAAAPFTLADPIIRQFDSDVPLGTVIDALAADGTSLTGVATYGEKQPVTLVVSVGALPDVNGLSVSDATAKLQEAGLEPGAIRAEEYSDTVPEGNAIRLQIGDGSGPVRVGDTVDIITSQGVEQVEIPNVVGDTWDKAKPILEEAGFALDYNIFADVKPDQVVVSGLSPPAGTLADKGSTVKVSFSF
jgi:serine/threonine-protein kinase